MTRQALVVVLMGSFVGGPVRAEDAVRDADLARGKEQVRQGEYDAGIVTLTAVVRRLQAVSGRDAEAADACLHLGIAYAGLGQTRAARSQFVQALKRDPSIAPDPKAAPANALEAFAAARGEAEEEGVLAAARQARKKKGPGTKIALGVGALGAGVGVALAAGGGGQSAIPPKLAFIPVTTSPLILLVGVQPPPGSTFSAGSGVTVSLQSTIPATSTEELRFFYVAEALTAEGRICLSGRSGPYGLGPGGTLGGLFGLTATCTPPFTTESLEIALEDVDTGARRFRATYRGRLQVVP